VKIKVYKWACRLGVFPLLVASLLGLLSVKQVTAQDAGGTPQPEIPVPQAPTPSQVIEAINTLRMSHGIAPLGVHPVLMQIGQMEAEGIAGGMGGHWRPNGLTLGQWLISLGYPLSGDLSMDGYRSENWGFAQDAPGAVSMWLGDDEHSNTMLALERSDIGVGIAPADDGSYVVVVETALQTKSGLQQTDAITVMTGIPLTQSAYSGMSTQAAENGLLPQNMFPVVLNTALADGNVYHEVKYGQTLWSIAIAYGTTIKQTQQLNGLVDTTVQTGQRLLIMQHATQPAPDFKPQIIVLPTMPSSTQTLTPTATLVPQAASQDLSQYKRQDMFGVIAIGIAALFLGGLFAVMTKKKQM
jgi:LysM repeat protein